MRRAPRCWPCWCGSWPPESGREQAIVEHRHHRPARPAGPGLVAPVEAGQKIGEVARALGSTGDHGSARRWRDRARPAAPASLPGPAPPPADRRHARPSNEPGGRVSALGWTGIRSLSPSCATSWGSMRPPAQAWSYRWMRRAGSRPPSGCISRQSWMMRSRKGDAETAAGRGCRSRRSIPHHGARPQPPCSLRR